MFVILKASCPSENPPESVGKSNELSFDGVEGFVDGQLGRRAGLAAFDVTLESESSLGDIAGNGRRVIAEEKEFREYVLLNAIRLGGAADQDALLLFDLLYITGNERCPDLEARYEQSRSLEYSQPRVSQELLVHTTCAMHGDEVFYNMGILQPT